MSASTYECFFGPCLRQAAQTTQEHRSGSVRMVRCRCEHLTARYFFDLSAVERTDLRDEPDERDIYGHHADYEWDFYGPG